jgi:hypothetical protein
MTLNPKYDLMRHGRLNRAPRTHGYTVRLTDDEHALFMQARALADRENVENAGPVVRRALLAWAGGVVSEYKEAQNGNV